MNAGNTSLPISRPRLPQQQTHHGLPFPLVVQCDAPAVDCKAVAAWIGERRDELARQAGDHGAILFRGFPVETPDDFDRFIAAFDFENFPYDQSLSNAVRVNFTPRVFSANEAPPNVNIFLHHEMAQTPIFPGKLFFFCRQPAEQGGATPLCRSDVLFERMTERCPQFARDCEQKG
ncbi:MAG: TauD/TfdA family dioxygenase, partial [Pirellulales bacterium]